MTECDSCGAREYVEGASECVARRSGPRALWPLQPTSRLLQKLKLLLSLLLLPPLPLLLLPPPPPKTDANESICAPSAITGSNCCR